MRAATKDGGKRRYVYDSKKKCQTASGKPAYQSTGAAYWAPVMKAADLVDDNGKPKFTVHALRHACVSALAELGVPPLEIARQVGHSALDMTIGIYCHLFKDAEDRATPAMEAMYRALCATGATDLRQGKQIQVLEMSASDKE